MSRQTIGPRESALRAMREAEKPTKATVPALPKTSGIKPIMLIRLPHTNAEGH
jgi:hypothetical protein